MPDLRSKKSSTRVKTVGGESTAKLVNKSVVSGAKKKKSKVKAEKVERVPVVIDHDDDDDDIQFDNPKLKKQLPAVRTDLEDDDDNDLGYVMKKVEANDDLVTRTREILDVMDAERLRDGIESDSTYEFYRAALIDTLEMVPIARRSYIRYTSQSNAYAYNALITKCQELIADLQSLSDRANVLQRLMERNIRPCFANIIANIANSHTFTAAEFASLGLNPEDQKRVLSIFMNFTRGIGSFLQESQNKLVAELEGELREDD